MENQSDDRPPFIWEYFVDTPWDQKNTLGSPIMQVIHFYEQLFFEDALYEAGYTIEEISQIIIEDTNMRQFPGGPINTYSGGNYIDI
jgi:hypothetical protein